MSANKIQSYCLIALSLIAITMALIYTRSVMVPFFISLCLFAILKPTSSWIQSRLRIPRAAAVGFVFLCFVLASLALLVLTMGSLERFAQEASSYPQKLQQAIIPLEVWLQEKGIDFEPRTLVSTMAQEWPLLETATSLTGWVFNFVSKCFLVAIFVLFLIMSPAKAAAGNSSALMFEEMLSTISRYLILKFLSSTTTGFLVGMILWVAKVDLAFMFGVLTFCLNFIPSVGSIVATLLPVPIVFLKYSLGWELACIIGIMSSVQVLIGNILEPKVLGDNMDLHPVTILIFLLFWGLAWGVAGMFLAVPITVIAKIVLHKIETTRPAAELMAGRIS